MRVLVADDDEVIRQLIAVHLTAAGFGVILAAGGAAALELAAVTGPAVAVLDAGMPRPAGRAVAAILRADPATAAIRTVVLWPDGSDLGDQAAGQSAGGQSAGAQPATRESGIDAALGKPFSPAELVTLVRALAGPRKPARLAAGNSTGWPLRLSCLRPDCCADGGHDERRTAFATTPGGSARRGNEQVTEAAAQTQQDHR